MSIIDIGDTLPCLDCGCEGHTARQSRAEHDWRLCDAHENGEHERVGHALAG